MGKLKDIISKAFGRAKLFFGNSLITGMEVPAPSTKDFLESFRASSLVHSCTKKIGEKMSTTEWELYQLRGLKAHYLEQHELLDVLSKPNAMMSGSQLLEITSIYLSLLGNCYWYKARDARGQIIELWLMRPDLTTVVPAKDGSISHYKFRLGGKETNYPAEDIVQFKEPDPLSDYYGYSAVQSAMEVIRADVYAKKWNTRFFYNSARPDAILTTTQKIGAEDREEIRKKWTNKYGGWENAQKVAVLSHGLDYKQVSVTQKDMDFANMRIANRDDILMALQVPKSVIGVTDDVNRASADAGIYVFLSETIKPKMEKLTDILNQFFVDDYGDDLFLLSVDPTPDDKASKDDHYVKAHNKWLTTNEIRIAEGYEAIDGGDYIYQPFALMPMEEPTDEAPAEGEEGKNMRGNFVKIGDGFSAKKYYDRKKEERLQDIYRRAMRGRKVLRIKENLIKNITIEVVGVVRKALNKKKVESEKKYTADQKDVIWKAFDERLKGWDKKWKAMMKALWKKQKERALSALDSSGLGKQVKSSELELLNFEKEVKIFIKKATPIIKNLVDEAGNLALEEVGEKSIKKDFDISDPTTAKWIEAKAMKFGEEVNETTIKKLKHTLAEGVLEGESIQELKKGVEELFESFAGRGKTIARTEVLSSNNAGTVFGYKQSGVVEQKEWLAARDLRVRDSHGMADGQVVNIDKKFKVGGEELEYPGDPNGSAENIINCRCTTIPIIKE